MRFSKAYVDTLYVNWGGGVMMPSDIPQTLTVKLDPYSRFHVAFTGEQYMRVIEKWAELKRNAKKSGNKIRNGGLVQFDGSYWPGQSEIWVLGGLDYRTVVCLRGIPEFRRVLDNLHSSRHFQPWAVAIATSLLTKDGYYVVKRKPFFGDWPQNCYEIPGGFIRRKTIGNGLNVSSAMENILINDFTENGDRKLTLQDIQKIRIYSLQPQPTIAEYHILCVTQLNISFDELRSRAKQDLLAEKNDHSGLDKLIKMDRSKWHEPSLFMTKTYQSWLDLMGWEGLIH